MELMLFDVGGTEIKYSVMDKTLCRRAGGSIPTPMTDLKTFLHTLYDLWYPHREEVSGIAMSLPGFVDRKRGMILGGGALTYNWGQPVGPMLSALCGCPVRIANDGKCAALAEWTAGVLQGSSNACVFVIGTGVGGGLILNGQIVNGIHGTAGEFSFVHANAELWQDPAFMMANLCSTTALVRMYRARKGWTDDFPVDGRQLFAALDNGDTDAAETVKAFGRNVAIQIYNLTALLDLERVAIGGGISQQSVLIDAVRNAAQEVFCNAPSASGGIPVFPVPEITACQFGNEANQIGALYYYLQDEEQNAD